jgi:hypothetical protein
MNSLTWKNESKEEKVERAKKGFLNLFGMAGALIKNEKR